ncbi:DUF58 domain-containing protein [Stenotrophomonas mori]|uniref:DUF58 domain-containing protein n=1 Tax=Stenotrophomonas mori TaxID=2871096 RepID=A0ABT0SDP6_9GAMM|nr:DUF58 domain-containing protein [Stenotrophomonas mori]MCL7713120.1 DUF58 domain-containing protein [Stenotrophomonas mori]
MSPSGTRQAGAGAHGADPDAGIVPTLDELIALRRSAARTADPRRGRMGTVARAAASARGRGMEYAESRAYVPGDDARHIDWKLSARTRTPHTKTFHAERERLTLLVADRAPALYFGTRIRFKSVQAARAGAVAVWAALRAGDRVAALCGARDAAVVAPAGGIRGALRTLDALVRWYRAPPPQDDGLPQALERAARLLHPGAQVLVLADPASALAVAPARWSALARHADVRVLLLVDPLEMQPPACRLPLQTAQGRLQLDLAAGAARAAWEQAFAAPVQALCAALPAHRVQVQVLASDAASDAWLRPQSGGRR